MLKKLIRLYKEIIHTKLAPTLGEASTIQLVTTTMSWKSKKTGRPKEQGGHHRINISVDESTANILSITRNRSQYIEYCVDACTETKWIAFTESDEIFNTDFRTFETALTILWDPENESQNAIISTLCTFESKCSSGSFIARMKLNDNISSSITVEGTEDWCWSGVYNQKDFGYKNAATKNQDIHVIQFQIEPYGESDQAHIRNVTMFFEVVDGLKLP